MRAIIKDRVVNSNPYCGYTSVQRDSIYHYLLLRSATIPMISTDVEVPFESVRICVQDLYAEGLLWTTKKRVCRRTGRMELYYTTNPEYSPKVQRLSYWGR